MFTRPSPSILLTLMAASLAAASGGCAHATAGKVTTADELTRQIASLRAQNAVYLRQIEELENRVFILTDQVEAHRTDQPAVASPALPRVTLKRGQGVPSEDGMAVASPDDSDVEYVGEAARTTTKRPVLRLIGNANGQEPSAAEPTPGPPKGAAVAIVGEAAGGRPVPPARVGRGAQELYRRALDALTAGKHADAAAGFRDFLRLHPEHDFADNAQYWLGECYYDLKDYQTAAREFRRVSEQYPDGNKVPDAMLKLAFAELQLGETPAGRGTLERLSRRFPRHEAAGRAQNKLTELGVSREGKEGP